MNEKLRQLLEAEADKRFESEVVDRLRERRLMKLLPKQEEKKKEDDEISPEDAAILEAEFQQGENNAA